MASLIQKTATLIKANLHDMVDKALKTNSPAVLKQYIRDAESNLDELEKATATIGGEVRMMKRKYEGYKKQADEMDRRVDLFLMQGKSELARAAQDKMNQSRKMQEQYHAQWVTQQREYETLKAARLKLQTKIQTVRAEHRELEAMLKLAQSKEKTNKAIRSVKDLQGIGDSDIAGLRDSIIARIDKADAETDLLADNIEDQMDQLIGTAELDLQLEERKHRLGLGNNKQLSVGDDEAKSDADLLKELDNLELEL